MPKKETIIISLGGSLIIPEEIDTNFVRRFREMLLKQIDQGKRFLLIVGGGKTARKYQNAAQEIDEEITDEDRDWLGIHSTRLNAQFLRTVFRKWAYPRINTNPHDLEDFYQCTEPVIIAAGWRPGWSTDYDATLLAKYLDITTIINLSNIDYVYDKDPKKHKDAQKKEKMDWKEFCTLVGDTWDPGMNAPFDPIASKQASEEKMRVVIMNGKNIENLENYLNGKEFTGTTIE
ncbi:MAG: UMP kinase [Candidatus Moranbacteria bacterium]|nr:UMP kinase [Candidatus Moranbacteria bacterium]